MNLPVIDGDFMVSRRRVRLMLTIHRAARILLVG